MRRAGAVAAGLLVSAALLWFGLGMHRGLLLSGGIRAKVAPWRSFLPPESRTVDALSDPVWQFVPWLDLARGEILAGRAPLWNPHQDGGVPLLGNGISALGSPLLWPALVFGVERGWNVSLLLRLLVAACSAWLWLRDLGRSGAAAALGAIAFALSGAFVAWLEHPQTLTAAPIPLLLLFARRAAAGGTPWDRAGLAASTFLVLSGGHPETQAMAAILAGAVALRAGSRAAGGGLLRRLLSAGSGAAIGVGLAAPLLFPFIEYYLNSQAREGIGRRGFVLPLHDLARFLRPGAPGSNAVEAAATVSITALVLAFAGLRALRTDPAARFWAASALTILLVAYDNPIARALATGTPVYWTRALLFLPLALGYLASGALDDLRRSLSRRGSPNVAFGLAAALCAIAGVELIAAAQGTHGSTSPARLRVTTPILERLQADAELFRVLPLHSELPPNSATEYGLDDVRGYDALAPRLWRQRREAIGRFGATPVTTDALEPWALAPGGAALDLWNVKYLILDPRFGFGAADLSARKRLDLEEIYNGPDGKLLRNRRVSPRARLLGGGDVEVALHAATVWRVELRARRPDRLRVANPFFPGWTARLDARRAPIRSDVGTPMEIEVPAGHHRVELLYRPVSWIAGWITCAAAACALLWSVRRRPVAAG